MRKKYILLAIGMAFLLNRPNYLSAATVTETKNSDAVLLKHYTYQTLSPFQKEIFDNFIEEEFPKGSAITDILNENAGTRNKMRLATALFFRNQPGDAEIAGTIVKWIIPLQILDETSINYAVFSGSPKQLKEGSGFDQNMREFIGTDLITVYHRYKNQLPDDVRKQLVACLIRTARGALMRNVDPNYNNISIMSSFMMEYVGSEFNIPELKAAGLQKAKEIFANFQKFNTLCEYNSPTYYGVDFVGLALWREISSSGELREMGAVLEKELWLDVAAFYNANLQNICGPYLRSYGIDMKKYSAIAGIWIAAAVDNQQLAPIPLRNPVHDECNFIVPILELGISMPVKALDQFRHFGSPRFLTRITSNYYEGDRLKKVTAFIQKDWMMGGLWGNRKISHILKCGTMHWKSQDGDIGWLFVPGEGKTNVQVDSTRMKIFLADPLAKTFSIIVYSKGITPENFRDDLWDLKPMQLGFQSGLQRTAAEVLPAEVIDNEGVGARDYPFVIRITYEVPERWNGLDPLVVITPNYKSGLTGN